jgi:hypothetical protein
LHPEPKIGGVEFGRRISAKHGSLAFMAGVDLHMALLNQTRTNAPCAKTLGIKYFLQLHARSIAAQIDPPL